MWQQACSAIQYSIHPVIRKQQVEGRTIWHTLGTAFLITCEPHVYFLTNAHVVTENGASLQESDLALGLVTTTAGVAGLRVHAIAPSIDLAVLMASEDAKQLKPVSFAGASPLAIGTPVASMGFPLPSLPVLNETGGNLSLERRFAAGFVSTPTAPMPSLSSSSPSDAISHYELNMLSYPGISGSPVFDVHGKVVGMCAATRLHNQQVAAYAIALRNEEIFQFLDSSKISYRGPVKRGRSKP